MDQTPREYITGLFKMVSTQSILVIDFSGKLHRLYSPFTLIARIDLPGIKRGNIVQAQAIKMDLELKEVFIINNKAYYCNSFKIIL